MSYVQSACVLSFFFVFFFLFFFFFSLFFFQAEDGIRDLVRSRGLGDVYKRQVIHTHSTHLVALTLAGVWSAADVLPPITPYFVMKVGHVPLIACLLYTSDAADERSSVDLGGRRIIKKKTKQGNSSQGR